MLGSHHKEAFLATTGKMSTGIVPTKVGLFQWANYWGSSGFDWGRGGQVYVSFSFKSCIESSCLSVRCKVESISFPNPCFQLGLSTVEAWVPG